MKSYFVDEISSTDIRKIRTEVEENAKKSGLDTLFWVEVPEDLLSERQSGHHDCRPHVFAMELGMNWLKMELFVRNLKNMRCSCNAYSTIDQTSFAIGYINGLLERLGVRT